MEDLSVYMQSSGVVMNETEHINADHDILRKIWELHQNDNGLCQECMHPWLCPTRLAFGGPHVKELET